MTNSRRKGAEGELEWAKWLRDNFGLEARRGQQFKGTPDSPDVVGDFPDCHCEVKRVQALNIDKAMEKAVEDCGDDVPYVAHRKNRGQWMITVRACDLLEFATSVLAAPISEESEHESNDSS